MLPNFRFGSRFRSLLSRVATTALLIAAIICCYSSRAEAQWNEDGNNNIHNTNSGNVGIGTDTATPNAKLVVMGNLGLGSNDIESWTLQQSVIESLNTSIFFGQVRNLHLISNAYHNAGWKYKEGGFGVANYFLYNGAHYWRVGPTGTADSVIAWNDAMILDNSGNLGLGTTSPGSWRLAINGNTENTFPNGPALMKLESSDALGANVGPGINFSGVHNGTTATTFALISGVKENATAGNYAGRLVFGTRTHGAGAVDMTRMVIDSTGNVGMGTASPAQRLHLSSAVTTGTGLRIDNTDTGGRNFRLLSTGSGNTAGAGKFHLFDETGSAFRLTVDSSGNVGIGASAPAYKLHVNGEINATGLRINGTPISTGAVDSVFGRTGTVVAATNDYTWAQIDKSTSSLANLTTRSAGDLSSGTLLAARMPALTGDVTSAAGSVATTLANTAVTPGSYTNASITVDSKGRVTSASNGVGEGSQWTTSGSDLYRSTGKVAIGSATQTSAKLLVYSGDSGATEYTSGGFPELTLESSSVSDLHLLTPNTGSGRIWFSSPSSNVAGGIGYTHNAVVGSGSMNLNAGAATRMTLLGNGNVGIGVTDPLSRLDLSTTGNTTLTLSRNDTVVSANDQIGTIQFWNNDTELTTQNIFGSIQVKASSAVATDAAAGYMTFSTTGTGVGTSPVERMRIDAAGNVGLGTTAPGVGHRLDVQGGSINSSGGLCIAGDCKTAWSEVGGSDWTSSGANINNTNTGNVGIGTTTPTGKLEVKSAASASNSLILNTTTAGFADSLVFQEAGTGKASIQHNPAVSAGALLFNTNGIVSPTNTRMVITSTGTVGIGTTSPNTSYKLDVNGNTNVTGNINLTGTINAKYQDVAEWVPSTHALPAGTVVTLDPTKSNHVEASSKAYDTRVAGVISAQPGIALGEQGENKVLVATTGRVRVMVDASAGPIGVGDLLVTSDVEGVAMKSEPVKIGNRPMHLPGTLIGKALEPLEKGRGQILVLLSLQ